jgi:hypothetical protein
MLSKKHYKAIAEILHEHAYRSGGLDEVMLGKFCDYFRQDNPRFDEQRFREAVFSVVERER